jgi:exopolysaccharide biosynthesis polyprenyl glycosylphosphotransferase
MKRSELFFDAVRLPVDFLACITAGLLAYWIRLSPLARQIRPVLFEVDLPLREYLTLVVAVSLFAVLIFALLGLYAMESTRRAIDEFTRIAAGATLAILGIIFFMFIRAEVFNSRFLLIAAWVFAVVLLMAGRAMIRLIQVRLVRQGVGVHRVMLIGNTPITEGLKSLFAMRPELGYLVVGQMEHVERSLLEQAQRTVGVDEIIRCDPSLPEEENMSLLDFCEDYKIDFRYIPDFYETRVGNVLMRTLGGYPIVELRRTPLEGWGRIWKRLFDLAASGTGLFVLAPSFLLVAIAITTDTQGPVFFRQMRIGRHQRSFRIVKFRTMVRNAEELKPQLLPYNERSGRVFKMTNDPRATRMGRFLRMWRIDEFPQLFNVLRGDMSLIGPRPHLPEEIAEYEKHHRKLFTIKPGITGLAQVSGSSSLPFEKESALDIHYIEHWSPKLDFFVFFRTIRRLLGDRSAV